MPLYVFQHPEDENLTKDIFFNMNDDKKFVDEEGTEWKRVFLGSQLSCEASIDPWDNADFVNKTANKKGSYGDLLDKSAELSAQRAEQNGGIDPVKQKYYKNYSEKRKGAVHPDLKPKTFENKNLKIEL
jgi:hypothetical protein